MTIDGNKLFGGAYQGKRALVTGHTGFKGSWLAIWLREMGADVCGYSLPPPSDPSHHALCNLDDKLDEHISDVRDFSTLRGYVDKTKPEIIFHLAAQPLVRESYRTPRETFETNVMGTINALECARHQRSVRAVVVITSDKCYENREWEFAYRENDPMGGFDPYSASKGCAELVVAAYRRSFFSDRRVGIATARAGNVIGGGDWADDRLVPDCARSLSANKPVIVRNPRSVRPWQHVVEPLAGYLQLGAGLLNGDIDRCEGGWNFGPVDGGALTTHEIAKAFLRAWGSGTIEIASSGAAVHEANLLRLSCDKVMNKLGWRPVLAIEEAIDWAANWYAAYAKSNTDDHYLRTCQDLARYIEFADAQHLKWVTAC